MPKLPTGMKRKENGSIEYRFTVSGHRRSVSGRTVDECIKRASDVRSEALRSPQTHSNDVSLYLYGLDVINAKSAQIRPSTLVSYEQKLRAIHNIIGDVKVRDITRRDLLNYQSDFAKHYATSMANSYMATIRTLLDEAVVDGLISESPYKRIKALKRTEPKANTTIHAAFTPEEQKLFFEYAVNSWYLELFQFMALTGVRIGEAAALTYSDIDDDVIRIRKTVAKGKDGLIVNNSPKTAAGVRDIPLTARIRSVIQSQKKKVSELRGIRYVRSNSRIFVPDLVPDKLLSSASVDLCMRKIIEKINADGKEVGHRSAHAFRDTFATRAIEQGMQPLTLMKILGHADIKMTMGLYAQVMQDTKAKEMNLLDIVL